MDSKISEYSNFIKQTLQPQLQAAVEARLATKTEISEYVELKNKLLQIVAAHDVGPINTIVDIAHQAVYCKATIPNPRTIYINVGFGFHIEMKIPEAIEFIDKRVDYLEKEVLKYRSEVADTVAQDVENALELLEQLGEELAEIEGASK